MEKLLNAAHTIKEHCEKTVTCEGCPFYDPIDPDDNCFLNELVPADWNF